MIETYEIDIDNGIVVLEDRNFNRVFFDINDFVVMAKEILRELGELDG